MNSVHVDEIERYLSENRHLELDEVIVSEMKSIESNHVNSKTVSQTKLNVRQFKSFSKEQKLPDNIEDMPKRYSRLSPKTDTLVLGLLSV